MCTQTYQSQLFDCPVQSKSWERNMRKKRGHLGCAVLGGNFQTPCNKFFGCAGSSTLRISWVRVSFQKKQLQHRQALHWFHCVVQNQSSTGFLQVSILKCICVTYIHFYVLKKQASLICSSQELFAMLKFFEGVHLYQRVNDSIFALILLDNACIVLSSLLLSRPRDRFPHAGCIYMEQKLIAFSSCHLLRWHQ